MLFNPGSPRRPATRVACYRRARLSALAGRAFGRGDALTPRRASPARRVRISVVFDDAPDCRCHRGELVGGEANCRHGSDVIGRHLSSKEKVDMPRDGASGAGCTRAGPGSFAFVCVVWEPVENLC
jgi:hypothetical protein